MYKITQNIGKMYKITRFESYRNGAHDITRVHTTRTSLLQLLNDYDYIINEICSKLSWDIDANDLKTSYCIQKRTKLELTRDCSIWLKVRMLVGNWKEFWEDV